RRNRIEIRWNPRGPLPTLVSRPQDIESALMNLVSNGIDATPPGGSVTIMAAPAARGSQAGLEISVIDTGSGIPQSVLPRIFDPFFTTKPVGKGTGIGLALTRQAVESLAGRIEVRSAEGIGTTMRIWLPLVPPEGSTASAAPLVPDLTSPAPAALTRARANGGDST
ncbi:MAG TPA: HAMP domain-containing sensor histidine kinase, partial [Polyangia bacterium]